MLGWGGVKACINLYFLQDKVLERHIKNSFMAFYTRMDERKKLTITWFLQSHKEIIFYTCVQSDTVCRSFILRLYICCCSSQNKLNKDTKSQFCQVMHTININTIKLVNHITTRKNSTIFFSVSQVFFVCFLVAYSQTILTKTHFPFLSSKCFT